MGTVNHGFSQSKTVNSYKFEATALSQAPWLIDKSDYKLENNRQIDSWVNNLMSQMTLKEKIGQLNLASVGFDVTGPLLSQDVESKIDKGWIGGVFNTFTPVAVRKLQERAIKNSRLHIPLLFGYDVIHGHRTIFPIPLGLSCTWNPGLIEQTASVAALESSADGLNWTFSPMVDIAHDPRWGRVSEGAGEDPYLGSMVAKAMVKGYQGNDLRQTQKIMACVKHFALYGAAESGRDYNTVDMSTYKMHNDYLPPYRAAINAGVGSVMTAFNDVNGVPSTCNETLMQDLLRKSWNFKGMVVTDYTAINELVNHGVGSEYTVSKKAIKAGSEMDMVGEFYLKNLEKIVSEDPEYLEYVNRACRNILISKYRLGLFSDPYRGLKDDNSEIILSQENLKWAQKAAEESFVLLQNNKDALPLKAGKSIAFIGPQIKRKRDLIGNWSGAGDWKKAVSIWEAINQTENIRFASNIKYALGCNLLEESQLINRLNQHDGQIPAPVNSDSLLKEAMEIAKNSDVIVVALGEAFGMSGEAASMSKIGLPTHQIKLLESLHTLGKPIILVLYNGRPLILDPVLKYTDAVLECWFPGTEGGNAIVNTLFGKNNPSGRLTMSFPKNEGQIPVYYNTRNTGRPFDQNQKYTSKYLDVPNEPLFPFGFGLSYTQFEYNKPELIQNKDGITVSVKINNVGKYEGDEVVQVYFRDVYAEQTRPKKQLIRFQKVHLKPSESQKVEFQIPLSEFGYYNADGKWIFEKGDFELFVGNNAHSTQQVNFTVN